LLIAGFGAGLRVKGLAQTQNWAVHETMKDDQLTQMSLLQLKMLKNNQLSAQEIMIQIDTPSVP
jgi:hypothetical protein